MRVARRIAARLAGDRQSLPGSRRCLGLGADDLDLVAILQIGHQRGVAAIDAATDAAVADVGVNGIGEVDGVGALGKRDEVALGGEAEDLVGEQLELGVLEELPGIVAFREDVDEAPQPAIGIGLGGRQANALPGLERGADVLVEAMRRNAASAISCMAKVRICSSTRM